MWGLQSPQTPLWTHPSHHLHVSSVWTHPRHYPSSPLFRIADPIHTVRLAHRGAARAEPDRTQRTSLCMKAARRCASPT
eukprot:1157493-Rhodomonas_salina.1